MARSDYAHWNEDADYMWYQEEGRFTSEELMDGCYCDRCGGTHSSYHCPPEDEPEDEEDDT